MHSPSDPPPFAAPQPAARKPLKALGITQPLDTPYRARQAKQVALVAAFALAVAYAFSALVAYFDDDKRRALIGTDKEVLCLIMVALAIVAAWLGVVLGRRSPAWAYWAVLLWPMVELTRVVPALLYGGALKPAIALLAFLFALQGLRGYHAELKLAKVTA